MRDSRNAVDHHLGSDPNPLYGGFRALKHFGGEDLFHTSRYENEYGELEFLAKGGFGSVFKARNKLDGIEYAIKKLVIKYYDPEVIPKIIREVTTLARLNHPNVLSYKTAWLEPYVKRKRSNYSRQISKDSWSPSESQSKKF